MKVKGCTVLTPTMFTKEELKDVKYHLEGGWIYITHPNHPVYRINQSNYEDVEILESLPFIEIGSRQ